MPATNVLRLTYHSSDPKVAAQLLNGVANSVVQENIKTNKLQASALRMFLEAKIVEQQTRVQEAETAESNYLKAQGQISLETQTKNLVNSLTELENEERTLQAQIQAAAIGDDLLEQVTGVDTFEQASQIIRLSEDEELKKLQTKLKELENTISSRRSYLTDKAPELRSLLKEQNDLQILYEQKLSAISANGTSTSNALNNATSSPYNLDLISKYVSGQIEKKALENRLSTVKAELSNLRVQISQIPVNQKPLAQLVRQREKAEASLKLLQSQLEEVEIAEARPTSSTRIVDLASVNTIPVFPRPGAILAISSFAGAFLAIAMVMLLEVLNSSNPDNTVKTEVEFPLPILGILPELPFAVNEFYDPEEFMTVNGSSYLEQLLTANKSSYLEHFLNNSALVEPYRALLKTLESSANKSPFATHKTPVIVFSSIVAGKEKSSAVVHLSAVAAMLSRRTLIIDADLRQPMQHRLLNVPSCPGLTEVLKNPQAFSSIVQSTAIENLSVLTHGQFSNRPAALIESKSMKVLLAKVADYYDLVIVDASPVSLCADAATLGQLTDNLALVIQPNIVPQETMFDAISKVKDSGVPILGVVINKATGEHDNSRLNDRGDGGKTHYLSGKTENIAKALKNKVGSLNNFI